MPLGYALRLAAVTAVAVVVPLAPLSAEATPTRALAAGGPILVGAQRLSTAKGGPFMRLSLLRPGGRLRTLRSARSGLAFARWSPDGKHIAFVTYVFGQGGLEVTKLYVMKPDGSGLHRINTVDYGTPSPNRSIELSYAWSPDGRRLVLSTATAGIPRIYLVDVGGRRLADLTPAASKRPSYYSQVAWSPSGRWIGFERFRGDYSERGCCLDEYDLMRPDGSQLKRLFRIYEVVHDTGPSVTWAPSGRRLALVTGGRDRLDPPLAIVDVPSGRFHRIRMQKGAVPGLPPSLVWLPGERHIALLVLRKLRWVYTSMRTDGSQRRELLSGRSVSSARLAPDGRWILVGVPARNARAGEEPLPREVALVPTSSGALRPLAYIPGGMSITDLDWQRLRHSASK
jgi:dipeptidyl aminopeptidase/acylaminoacyl peptidase